MTDENKVLVSVVVGMGIVAFILARRGAGFTGYTEDDVGHVARTIWAETSMRGGTNEEYEAIGQVLVNRARIRNGGGPGAVELASRPPGSPLWNGHSTFRRRWSNAHTSSTWEEARRIARRVLSGEAPNRIGDRMQFVHPSGSPRCSDNSTCKGRRLCVDGRCIPIWSVAANDAENPGGNAPNAPIKIGRAIVS